MVKYTDMFAQPADFAAEVRAELGSSSETAIPQEEINSWDDVELLTVADFTRRYRIGKTSFYREVERGRLKIVKFGTATRVRRTDAEQWLRRLPTAGSR